MIVAGVDLDRVYSADEIVDMFRSGKLKDVTLEGYTSRADADGNCRFVHWTELDVNRLTPGSPNQGLRTFQAPYDYEQYLRDIVNAESPITRRTPQQRLASMMVKLMAGAKETGTIEGLSEDAIRAIVGDSWKSGEPIPAEAVRRVAAHYLGGAEREAERTARTQTGRAGRKARREQERIERKEKERWEKQRASATS